MILLGKIRSHTSALQKLVLFTALSVSFAASNIVYSNDLQYFEEITLFVPSTKGGGWDKTAEAMRETLLAEKLVGRVEIVHSPGIGGLIGLAQFIEAKRGHGASLLVGGMGMVGATESNRSTVSLSDTSFIARLTGEVTAIAVPSNSQITDYASLVDALVTDPSLINWGGGSAGGSDEILLRRMASRLGVPLAKLNYRALPGGGDVAKALMRGEFVAGLSGYSEFAPYVERGDLVVLAISAENRLQGVNVPTLTELGVSVVGLNWRGVFGPPDITTEQKSKLVRMVSDMANSNNWHEALQRHWWQDWLLTGPDLKEFVYAEQEQAKQSTGSFASEQAEQGLASVVGRRYWLSLTAGGFTLLLIVILIVYRVSARRREYALTYDLKKSAAYAEENAAELSKVLAGITARIDDEFAKWHLTEAEQDVCMLMLKGLRLQEIADVRGTSERTVRQQAQSIYTKSGVEGRSSLAAYFLEDFFAPSSSFK